MLCRILHPEYLRQMAIVANDSEREPADPGPPGFTISCYYHLQRESGEEVCGEAV